MNLEIDGLLRGRDMGYSVRHPDYNYLDEFCCCEERHCHLPGETPKERSHYASLMIAAPEMLELLRDVRRYVADANLRGDGYAEIDLKAIDALLAKIEGGEV